MSTFLTTLATVALIIGLSFLLVRPFDSATMTDSNGRTCPTAEAVPTQYGTLCPPTSGL